ncbi:MAG: hypothetical protein KJO29_13200, partial [Bacteroidia bacterium]|nr:hypothetical protein [Bacteroidia bacterium]
ISIEIVSSANGDSEAIFVDEIEGDTSILEFKATDQGIYDYVLFEGDKSKPATLVEYEASIGTQWEYTLPSGTVVRRELVEKGNLFKVEQTYPNIPFAISIENIEWEISPQKGVVACTINYTDEDPIRLDID